MTQLSRIEYSQSGGLCYSDAIDNSAGVDTSDHEVNLKILLNGEMQSNRLTLKERNSVLSKMENSIAKLVLENNYLQTQILSIETTYSAELMPGQSNAILQLEQSGLLDREIEFLPDNTTLKERFEIGKFLTRPELAVLLSYSKMDLYQELLESDLPDQKYLKKEIEQYFPELVSGKYLQQIYKHRLRREIISTQVTNNLVGIMGPTFHLRIADLTGSPVNDIVRAYIAARDILGTREINLQIQSLDNKIPADLQMQCLRQCAAILENSVLWLLRSLEQPLDINSVVSKYKTGFRHLIENGASIIDSISGNKYQKELATLTEQGVPESLARTITAKSSMSNGMDIVDIALKSKRPVSIVAEMYFGVANLLELPWLEKSIASLKVKNIWHERSKFSLTNDLRNHQSGLTKQIIHSGPKLPADKKLGHWSDNHEIQIRDLRDKMGQLKQEAQPDFSMLSVLVSELNRLK